MDDNGLVEELEEVETELVIVQNELDTLLQRQEELVNRKDRLVSQLESLESSKTHQRNVELASQDWEEGQFPWSPQVASTLKSTFKIEGFRPLQLSCINATLSRKDTILVMPTGGGKSLCYQLPAVLSEGLTLIVSPLVSLMEDQLLAVKNLGIESRALNASTSREELNSVHMEMTQRGGMLKLLYVTPEKLSKSKRFMSKLEKAYESGLLSRIVIDEVHCASQWGHDFRPDYKILGILKRQFPSVPILGLTATATPKVLEDVKGMLSLRECLVFRASYNRKNLFYEVRMKSSVLKTQMESMAALIKRKFAASSGIVYCFSRKDTEEVASGLCERGIRAAHYHADLPHTQRSGVHMKWLKNSIQVIVATVAFGMGIDKPDVRFVIHHSISKSMENYYQESGRAGRDGKPARCVVFFRAADAYRQSTMVFTEHTGLQNLYAMLRYCLNKAECRRAVIARCFRERWSQSDCDRSCDVCSLHPLSDDSATQGETSSSSAGFLSCRGKGTYVCTEDDISERCKVLVSVVEGGRSKEKKLTALKVVEAWRKTYKNSPTPTTEECDNMLLEALLVGVLKEDFHFTPYSTISYIGIGQKAEALKRGIFKVKVRKRTAKTDSSVGTSSPGGIPAQDKACAIAPSSSSSKEGSSRSLQKTKSLTLKKRSVSQTSKAAEKKGDKTQDLKHSDTMKNKLPKMLLSSSSSSTTDLFSADFLPPKRPRFCPDSLQGIPGEDTNTTGENVVIEIDSD